MLSRSKKFWLAAVFGVVNALLGAGQLYADHEYEAGRLPDGSATVICEWCLFINCDCNI